MENDWKKSLIEIYDTGDNVGISCDIDSVDDLFNAAYGLFRLLVEVPDLHKIITTIIVEEEQKQILNKQSQQTKSKIIN